MRFGLIFIRISGILFALPIFGDTPTPVRVRILMSVALTAIMSSIATPSWQPKFHEDVWAIALMIAKELSIGLIIGYVAKAMFAGVTMAASIVGYQMGFGMANMMVPDANAQMNAFTNLHRILAILIFLALDLHHMFIFAIASSFQKIGPAMANLNVELGSYFITLTSNIFTVSMQLSAPVLIALIFTMTAMGLIAKTVPQLNIFTFSFPCSFFIGLTVYISSLSFLPQWLRAHFEQGHESIIQAIKGLI